MDASVFKCVPIMVEKETVYHYITDITEVLLLAHQQIKVLNQICVFFLFKIENPLRFFTKRSDIPHQFLTSTYISSFGGFSVLKIETGGIISLHEHSKNKKSPPKSAIS